MPTNYAEPRVDAADLLASLSARARTAVEQTGIEDVEALACKALARDTPKPMKTGPVGRVFDEVLAEAFLDYDWPLVATLGLARLMVGALSITGRARGNNELTPKVSRELGEAYVLHRVCADMRACPAVRGILLELPRFGSPYSALLMASRTVNLAKWDLRCWTFRRRPASGLPPRSKWLPKALAKVPAPYYLIPAYAAELGVDVVLALDRQRGRVTSSPSAPRLRSLLVDTADQWEKVKSLMDETSRYFYQGRYSEGLEADSRLRDSLRQMDTLHRRVEKAIGAAGLRSFTVSFGSAVPTVEACFYPMTAAYEWMMGLS